MTCCNHDCNQGRNCPNRKSATVGLRNIFATIGFVATWIAIGMAHAGYFDGIDITGAALRALMAVAGGVAWVVAVVVVSIIGPTVVQIIYSRWERRQRKDNRHGRR